MPGEKKARSIYPLVLATHNKHKIHEIKAILRRSSVRVKVKTLDDFPKAPPVRENRATIKGNAAKKAREVAKRTGHLALADDTGLFIKALGGRPGVYSARFAGPGCSYEDNNRKVLRLMIKTPVSERQASFRCVAALATPTGSVVSAEGRIEGLISQKLTRGTGFGYDPIFFVPAYKKTFAQMSAQLKNKISHRAKAFSKVPSLLRKFRTV